MFGSAWKSEIARELGRSDRLVRFWAVGARGIDGAAVERLAMERCQKLRGVIDGCGGHDSI